MLPKGQEAGRDDRGAATIAGGSLYLRAPDVPGQAHKNGRVLRPAEGRG